MTILAENLSRLTNCGLLLISGFDPESILVYMRERAPEDYRQLMSDYRVYLECKQMVQTGYFKRSIDQNEAVSTTPPQQKDVVEKQFMNQFGETMRQLGSGAHIRDLKRNIFSSVLVTDRANATVPSVKQNALPFIIKR